MPPPPQNLIKLKQLHLPSLSGYITGIAYTYANSGDLNLSGFLSSQISGTSGYLHGLINSTTGQLTDFTFSIASGVDVINCNFGSSFTGRATFSVGSSGAGDPLILGMMTFSAPTGVRISLSNYTPSPNYYAAIHI